MPLQATEVQFILFPGRHHLITRFQIERLSGLLRAHPRATVVWAITSANHGGTQRNPIPGMRRLGMIESVAAATNLPSLTYLIANKQPKPDFAHYVIEEIRTQTGGRVAMTPENTLVACSTPAVISDYEQLGFAIDPVERGANNGTDAKRPWEVVEELIESGATDPTATQDLHPAALEYFLRYGLGEVIEQVYADPLIDSDDGDITITRDYATYRAAFEDNAWRKVSEFGDLVRPGRIVDVGCATGQTIKLLSEKPALFESDFYGVEVARPLYEICVQRAENGEFGDANVFFHQRNILQTQLFEPDSLDTVITMALTHEIESYLGRDALHEFCEHVSTMLRPGGIWINYDVVGPDNPDELVLAQFTSDDGLSTGNLRSLSTRARFERFVHDFRHEEGDGMTYRSVLLNGVEYCEMRRADLYDFLAKKDYVDSWLSEAHERFCFFSPDQWIQVLEAHGFVCTKDSRPIQNSWLIENRFSQGVEVFRTDSSGALEPDDWSWTNVLLVAEKPER